MKSSRRIRIVCAAVAGWLVAICATAAVKIVDLPANDLVYDPHSGLLYASVPSEAGELGNTVTAIDPELGEIVSSVFVGSEPSTLAVSGNGRFLYVGIDGAAAIRRVTLPSLTAGPQFEVGTDPSFGPMLAEDIEVQPGNANVIAVSLLRPGISPRHGGVAIFDNGVRRPEVTQEYTGSNRIEFSADPGVVYGYNNETTEFGFRTLQVNDQGVSEVKVTRDLISGFSVDIEYDSGFVFAASGEVVNPIPHTLRGTFSVGFFALSVLPEVSKDQVLFLTETGIEAFRFSTFTPTGSTPLPGELTGTPRHLVRWGSNGLALHTDSQVVILGEEDGGAPEPPAGPWLSAATLPGYEAKIRFNDVTVGKKEADCIAQTLCVSGAVAGRQETFIRVIRPRPNGFLWIQISRFTPSKVTIWLRQKSTGKINYYVLAAVPASVDNISGILDRGGFRP